MDNIAIALSNVGKTCNKVTIVDDLCLTIERKIFGLVKIEPCEKIDYDSESIALAQNDRETIEVAGYDVVHHLNLVKRNIGVVLQQISVDGKLSIWENLEFHGRMHHIANPERRHRIDTWLNYVGLSDRRNSLAKTLSSGMKHLRN